MRLLAATLSAILILAPPMGVQDTPAADAQTVLAHSRQRLQTADFRATGHVVRIDAKGARTSYPITLKGHWFPGVLRLLCVIDAAGDARVHILLEMRPNGQDSIRIAHPGDKTAVVLPFEKWSEGPIEGMGPGFSFEDFLEAQYFWSGQKVVENTKYGARLCDLLKSSPGSSDRTHYAQVETWLDHSIGYPVYVEKTIKATGRVKEFTYFGLRQNGGVWSASQVEGKIRGHAGSTLLIIDRGSTKANLGLGDFSPEKLTRF
jgi:hypothetical protein